MLTVLTNAVGILTFILLLTAAASWLILRASDHGILKPLLVGGALRLVVMICAHIASVAAGDPGTLVVDDVGFLQQGSAIAEPWLDGQFVDLRAYTLSISNGFPAMVATVFVLVGPSVFAAKLVNVLLGMGTVFMSGLIGGRLFGEVGKVRTAWVVALMPTVVWWSAEMIKEALVTFLVVGVVLALLSPPSLRSALGFFAAFSALYWTRPTAALAVFVGAAVTYGIVAYRNRAVLDWHVIRRVSAAAVGTGILLSVLFSDGNPLEPIDVLGDTAQSMADLYRDGSVLQAGADFLRVFFIPFPWNPTSPIGWDRALLPGVWVLIAMLPTAALGAKRLRSRPELLLLLVTMVTSFALYALTAGGAYRQRSSLEPLLALLFVAGVDSWEAAGRRGAILIAVLAPFAAVHTSIIAGGAVALGAVVLLAGSRLLPSERRQVALPTDLLVDQLKSLRAPQPRRLLPVLRSLQAAAPALPSRQRDNPRLPARGRPRASR